MIVAPAKVDDDVLALYELGLLQPVSKGSDKLRIAGDGTSEVRSITRTSPAQYALRS
jgi:hypothetical protein